MLPTLSLYIHIPWCVRKCPYCDFNSHESADGKIPEKAYLKALLADLEQNLPKERQIISIFFGGGTPSLLSAEGIQHLLKELHARLAWSSEIEITLEANPGTVTHLQAFREAGINRLSVGIQSFHDESLTRLGRIHNRQQALLTIEAAQQAGFDNLNLDLMFGLPQQTLQLALTDLETAIAWQPAHLSWYQLTIEPHTQFYHQTPVLPTEEVILEIQQEGDVYLLQQGYQHYEISAYAKPSRQCRHNLNYWQFGDYLGIGAGAHSKLTDAAGTLTRFSKQPHPATYLHVAHTPAVIATCTTLTAADISLEFMMNQLRLAEGFSVAQFEARTGLSIDYLRAPLQQAEAQGWLRQQGNYIQTTAAGRRFLNEVLELFVLSPKPAFKPSGS